MRVVQRIKILRVAPMRSRLCGALRFRFPPHSNEGNGAPKGANVLSRFPRRRLRQRRFGKRIAFRRSKTVIFDPASVQLRSGRIDCAGGFLRRLRSVTCRLTRQPS